MDKLNLETINKLSSTREELYAKKQRLQAEIDALEATINTIAAFMVSPSEFTTVDREELSETEALVA